jgi:hypothetical protein
MTITRSTFPALLWPGIQAIFGQSYEKLDKEYTRIFDVRTSKKAYEKVTEATGLGLAAVKSEGGSILYDNPSPGATSVFTHVTYGLGYIITREAEEDNQYQEVAEGNAASLPWSMLTTKEIVHANILNRASTPRMSAVTASPCSAPATRSRPALSATSSRRPTCRKHRWKTACRRSWRRPTARACRSLFGRFG